MSSWKKCFYLLSYLSSPHPLLFFKNCVCVCVWEFRCIWRPEVLDPLEMGLQAAVSSLMWGLKSDLGTLVQPYVILTAEP